jgi:hypothetical protein
VKSIVPAAILILLCITVIALADETSFHRIHVADPKGRQIKAELTFSDEHKAVEVHPVKGNGISIPYRQIDKFSYEYTKRHRINEGSIVTAPLGVGIVTMLTKSRSHWLEIDYFDAQNVRKAYVLRMDKNDYLRILDAVKTHTGKDAEVLGNADKRRK